MSELKAINRVLVLEKFNDGTSYEINGKSYPLSLVLALKDGEDADDGSFDYRRVKDNLRALEVHSFNEFLERFSPTIYQGFQVDDNGGYFVYSTNQDEIPGALPMKFDQTAFFKAALDMYEKKGVAGKSNYEFDYSCFSKLISPETALKEVKNKRRELEYSMQKLLEAKDSGNTALTAKCKKKVQNVAKEIQTSYKDNPTALLCLSVADLQAKLGISSDSSSANNGTPALETTKRDTYRLTYNSEGDIVKEKVIITNPNGADGNPSMLLEDRASKQVQLLLESKIKTNGEVNDGEAYTQNLVIDAYSGNTGIVASEDIPKIRKKYEIQKACYKAAQDSLLKAVNKIIEKVLDVKAMFDNASGDLDVVISNCTADELVTDRKAREYFVNFMENMNNNVSTKFWFAVLPQMDDDELVDREHAGVTYTPNIPDADDSVIDADYTEETPIQEESAANDDVFNWGEDDTEEPTTKQNLISLDDAKQLLLILNKAKCTTFFGFKGCEKTGFSKMTKSRLQSYKKKLDGINSRYSVFAYPNFTLMSGLQAGNIEVAQGETIQNPGLYLDAPYIAVGLTVRSLNSNELRKLGFKVHKDLPSPAVRFDFENDKNRYMVKTNMNCEEALKYDKSLLDELDENPFGFFFDCVGYYEGCRVTNTFVKYARNMANSGRIFRTFVKDYIWMEISEGKEKVQKGKIDDFKAKHKWERDAYIDCINNPLRRGESYFLDESEEGKLSFKIHFNDGRDDEVIDKLEVDDE